jgi:hypothetical protein
LVNQVLPQNLPYQNHPTISILAAVIAIGSYLTEFTIGIG